MLFIANETITGEGMNTFFDAKDIATYNERLGVDTQNPLVGLIDFSKVKPIHHVRMLYGFYAVLLGIEECGLYMLI